MIGGLLCVSLLCLSSFAITEGCNRQLMQNVDFPGSDIKTFYSPDVEHCQLLCTQQPSCHFFTFHQANWTKDDRTFKCFLKSASSGQPNSQTPLQGVTSGFSLKSCNPSPQPCLSQVYENVDFVGADYTSFFTADHEDCQKACTQDPSCQFFTYVKQDPKQKNVRNKCFLKYSWNIPRTSSVEKKVGVVSGFSQTPNPSQTACQNKFLPNTDIPGSDFQMLKAASAEHCQALCSAHPQCTYFTFGSLDFKCHLKNNKHHLETKAKEGDTSGMPARFCQFTNWLRTAYEGIDFPGSEIRFELKDNADQCQRLCSGDPTCQFYTYVKDNSPESAARRRCYLKGVITMPAPPKVVKVTNVVSGFSTRNCAATGPNRVSCV
uniref:Apple domain-containing protein n=1 Tax=Oryzias sinensis TaxID=183150 RepID=A0A8C8DNE1_9TELE